MRPQITDPSWTPPHPFGLATHPEWASVRERYREREAMMAQNVPTPRDNRAAIAIAAAVLVAVALVIRALT